MSLKPKSVRPATEAEIKLLSTKATGWDFPEEVFDGEWYRLTAPSSTEVLSMLNSYRHHAERLYGKKVQTRRKDGFLYVRRLDTDAKGI